MCSVRVGNLALDLTPLYLGVTARNAGAITIARNPRAAASDGSAIARGPVGARQSRSVRLEHVPNGGLGRRAAVPAVGRVLPHDPPHLLVEPPMPHLFGRAAAVILLEELAHEPGLWPIVFGRSGGAGVTGRVMPHCSSASRNRSSSAAISRAAFTLCSASARSAAASCRNFSRRLRVTASAARRTCSCSAKKWRESGRDGRKASRVSGDRRGWRRA